MSKLTLQGRISLVALATLVMGLGLFSWLGVQSVNDSINKTLDERLIMARMAASQLDETLIYVMVQLEDAARFNHGLPDEEQFDAVVDSLQDIFTRSRIYTRNIFLIDKNGKVLQVASKQPEIIGVDMSVYPEVKEALTTGQSSISGLVSSPITGATVVLISTAISNDGGEITGVLTSSIDIEESGIGAFSQTIKVGETGYTEIVDGNGIVLARTKPGFPPQIFERSDHPARFAELINRGEATVRTCHRCHETEGAVERQKDVLAFAPLSTASWGVAIRQSEEEALLPTHQLEKRFLILGIILLACTALLVWAMIQGIVKPIRMLTLAAKQLAVDDFAAAIPLQRKDEIGQLSNAFHIMRQEIARARDNMMLLYQEAKQKEELRGQLLSSIIHAQEEERKRIARELHDEYGQTLTGLIMSIESSENMITPAQSQLKEKLANTKSLLVRTLDDMRRLILDLRPSSLDDLGLVSAIQAYIQSYLKESGIKVKFKNKGGSERLSPILETALFRIIQEATHNVVKHAQANNIEIELIARDNKIVATVEDDGRGFDVDAVLKSRTGTHSLGILGIQERTALLGGTFSIKSQIGQGTRLKVEIPIGNSS